MIRAYDEYGNIIEDYEKSIYNKAIDDFADRLKQENKETLPTHSGFCKMNFDEVVDEIAEQLKAGDNND